MLEWLNDSFNEYYGTFSTLIIFLKIKIFFFPFSVEATASIASRLAPRLIKASSPRLAFRVLKPWVLLNHKISTTTGFVRIT